MRNFRDYDGTQRFLLLPDLSDWVADDDLAHFIVAAVERVDISAFHVSRTGSGKAQYHPRMMLALLIYCCQRDIFLAPDRACDAPRCVGAFHRREQSSRSRHDSQVPPR
jgi:hypothetical protein